MLKALLFIASALPIFLFVKSLLFRRSSGLRNAASNFNRQVGYLAIGIAAIMACSLVYYVLTHLVFAAPPR